MKSLADIMHLTGAIELMVFITIHLKMIDQEKILPVYTVPLRSVLLFFGNVSDLFYEPEIN